ncbi:hypothetical protein ACIHDR_49260 [Nocardia sp. NPDC052278]|uniref:hypothetical protein n=1 Tax=unclassified Nocardia TaxID=2637762 RepID=UPI0036BDEDD6
MRQAQALQLAADLIDMCNSEGIGHRFLDGAISVALQPPRHGTTTLDTHLDYRWLQAYRDELSDGVCRLVCCSPRSLAGGVAGTGGRERVKGIVAISAQAQATAEAFDSGRAALAVWAEQMSDRHKRDAMGIGLLYEARVTLKSGVSVRLYATVAAR